jgi:hypothetical protein
MNPWKRIQQRNNPGTKRKPLAAIECNTQGQEAQAACPFFRDKLRQSGEGTGNPEPASKIREQEPEIRNRPQRSVDGRPGSGICFGRGNEHERQKQRQQKQVREKKR